MKLIKIAFFGILIVTTTATKNLKEPYFLQKKKKKLH
jgi:hypothetical protein